MEINLESLLKLYGPLGLIVGFLLLVYWKKILPEQEQQRKELRADLASQQAEYRQLLDSTVDDARKERDAERQARAQEVTKFLESLKYRDEQFESVADAISDRRQQPRQK